jgi:hypothetical protein
MRPFENDTEVVTVSDLAVENGLDQIVIHGALELSRDRLSLQRIDALQSILAEIKISLGDPDTLPEKTSAPGLTDAVDVVENPFGDS